MRTGFILNVIVAGILATDTRLYQMTKPLSLHFQRNGEESLPKFVILHGLFGSIANFTSLAKALAVNYEVIRIDLRNHGRSPHAASMTYTEMAADVATSLGALDVQQAVVLGHSMGGKVAMQLAVDFPSLVSALIVADIAPKQYSAVGHNDVLSALVSLPLAGLTDRKAADQHLQQYLAEPMLRQFLLTNLLRSEAGFEWRINLNAIQSDYNSIAAAPVLSGEFDQPVLFLRGGTSNYIESNDITTIKNVFPTAKVVTIDGAGHWLHAEKPVEFLRGIQAFLNS